MRGPRALAFALLGVSLLAAPVEAAEWRVLEPGLALLEWKSSRTSSLGDSLIRAVRADPEKFALRLENASVSTGGRNLTARAWAAERGMVAAINASMFATDHSSSVALMVTGKHVNNGRLGRDNAVLAFDPLEEDVPAVQIIDRKCQDFEKLRPRYGSLVQNIRMISCDRQNTWAKQERKWSIATVGVDRQGRLLLIHSRSPHTVHDFVNELLAQDALDIKNAMYVEGGPEAQLFVSSGEFEGEWVGSFETGFFESDTNALAWPIPNVIGVVKR